MLKSVIRYGFKNYEIDAEELCDQEYGMSSSEKANSAVYCTNEFCPRNGAERTCI